jgi:arsenate reductase (thioredoxin)
VDSSGVDARQESKGSDRLVLFVCIENAARSLMAEAMFNRNPPKGWRAVSAGTQPADSPNPRTKGMLAEIGLELPAHPPQVLTDAMMTDARAVITMGCLDSESCPARLKTIQVRDWALLDPAKLDEEGFRRVRDDLRRNVEGLRRELGLADKRRASLAKTN